MPPPDPFTTCYQTIRTGLLAFAPFASLVKPGNFMDASAQAFMMYKTQLQADGAPDVMMMMGGFKLLPYGQNSMVSSFDQAYPIIIRHDTGLQITEVNQLKYYAHIGLLQMGDNLGLPFVRTWDIDHGMDDPFGLIEMKLGSIRYVTALNINVHMYQSRQQLLVITQ